MDPAAHLAAPLSRLVVVLLEQVVVYEFPNELKQWKVLETAPNPSGGWNCRQFDN